MNTGFEIYNIHLFFLKLILSHKLVVRVIKCGQGSRQGLFLRVLKHSYHSKQRHDVKRSMIAF